MRNNKINRLQYREFINMMKRYNREFSKKESIERINKLKYKPVFNRLSRIKKDG